MAIQLPARSARGRRCRPGACEVHSVENGKPRATRPRVHRASSTFVFLDWRIRSSRCDQSTAMLFASRIIAPNFRHAVSGDILFVVPRLRCTTFVLRWICDDVLSCRRMGQAPTRRSDLIWIQASLRWIGPDAGPGGERAPRCGRRRLIKTSGGRRPMYLSPPRPDQGRGFGRCRCVSTSVPLHIRRGASARCRPGQARLWPGSGSSPHGGAR